MFFAELKLLFLLVDDSRPTCRSPRVNLTRVLRRVHHAWTQVSRLTKWARERPLLGIFPQLQVGGGGGGVVWKLRNPSDPTPIDYEQQQPRACGHPLNALVAQLFAIPCRLPLLEALHYPTHLV
jgi:hypothetical protein